VPAHLIVDHWRVYSRAGVAIADPFVAKIMHSIQLTGSIICPTEFGIFVTWRMMMPENASFENMRDIKCACSVVVTFGRIHYSGKTILRISIIDYWLLNHKCLIDCLNRRQINHKTS
jgi:hypothetical protein